MSTETTQIAGRANIRVDSSLYILLAILVTAFMIRLAASVNSGIQIDESRMLFAIDTVAHNGLPLLGSDVFYLVGTPVSYLFTPFAWFFDGVDFLHAVRFGNVLLSTAAVFVIWQIALEITGSTVVAIAVGALSAFDPMGLFWGTVASPFPLLALLALILIYATIRAVTVEDEDVLREMSPRNPIFCIVLCLLFGSITYYAIWFFVPGIVIVSFVRWGKAVFASRHPMRIAFEVSIVFPILVWMLGSWIGPGSGTSFNPGPPNFNQIWNNWERLRDFAFNFDLWQTLYFGSRYSQFVPLFIAIATGMILALFILRDRISSDPLSRRRLILTLTLLLCSYWLPILIIANGSMAPLLLPLPPIGYTILIVAIWLLIPDWKIAISRQRIQIAGPVIAAILLMLPVALSVLQGARWQIADRVNDPDYLAASAFAASIKQPGQPVLTPFTTSAYMEMNASDRLDVVLLAGDEDSQRVESETRGDGSLVVDYWSGRPAVATVPRLCEYLMYSVPPPIILIDTERLEAEWGFEGEFEKAIEGGTQITSVGENGLEIRQPIPLEQWDAQAQETCGYQPGTTI